VVNVTNILGSGTYTDWTITFSAPGINFATAAEINTGTEAAKAIVDGVTGALSKHSMHTFSSTDSICWT